MKNEKVNHYHYCIFDEVTGDLYESGDFWRTRAKALEWMEERHYYYYRQLKSEHKRAKLDSLRSIIKDNPEAAVDEYNRMTGKKEA